MKLIAPFIAAIAVGIVFALGSASYTTVPDAPPPPPGVTHLTREIAVSGQLRVDEVAELGRAGYDAIIDLRPDGEAPDQAPSAALAAEARSVGIKFFYAPVAHGAIADGAVATLETALASTSGRVLLYCRSGKRAARTWSLVEASRPGGRNAAQILAAVKDSGQSADDLAADIARRIAARKTPVALQ